MERRQFLWSFPTVAAAGMLARPSHAADMDGTPMQFMPKTPRDSQPLNDEFSKYGKCPYCGMDRRLYHYSRHLIHYSDDLVDGVCSLHCAAISLCLNLDRIPKIIYAPDNGSGLALKPLIDAEAAFYVVGGDHKAVMSKTAKTSFASRVAAEVARGSGEIVDFNKALSLTYLGMAEDTQMIRMRRKEKRRNASTTPMNNG